MVNIQYNTIDSLPRVMSVYLPPQHIVNIKEVNT